MKSYIMTKAVMPAVALIAWLLAPQTAHGFYNPNTGRWLSRDRSQEAGGNNLYAFVANSSISRCDSLGDMEWDEVQGIEGNIRKSISDVVKWRIPLIMMPLGQALNAGVDGLMWEWFHSGGMYDFKSQQGKVGRPPSERLSTEIGALRADQFGNYLAGYAGTYAALKTFDWTYIEKTIAGGFYYGARDELKSTHPSFYQYFDDRVGQITMNYNGMVSAWSDFLDE
jgi:hypothetical protein